MTTPAARQALVAEAQAKSQNKPLPKLREDLLISQGPNSGSGKPTWLIYDPLRHRFIDIDQSTFEILSLWRYHTTVDSLCAAVAARTQRTVDSKQLEQLVAFFITSSLTLGGPSNEWRHLSKLASQRAQGLFMTLVHNYLFFKIPLASPQGFLEATYPALAPLFNRYVQACIALLGLSGLYLISRQWDEFISETRGLASLGGIAAFGAVLFVIKALHEMGHGYCAIRHKCRVPSMGLAFMMMAPLLYTDVTDAWRLKDRRKRLAIDAAGVAVELGIACIATFLWVFIPEGGVRHAIFLIATTSWVMSLAINLNPFMRFDGYYILSDLLGVPNLQPRAFTLGVWKLRELLFKINAPCPEALSLKLTITLIIYAWSVWIYRFFLFVGIAALVYTYFFKLLGIILFAFEIGYFVIKPIFKELKSWWLMRKAIFRSSRAYVTLAIATSLCVLAIVPWSTRITLPALLDAGSLAHIYPPRAARIKAVLVKPGDHVEQGQVLVELEQPDLNHEKTTTISKRDTVKLRLNRQAADRDDLDDKLVLESELLSLSSRLAGISLELEELAVKAPQSGIIAELNPSLTLGRWIAVKDQIALVTGAEPPKAKGYLPEEALWRVEIGSKGIFIPEVPSSPSVPVTMTSIGAGSSSTLDVPELASSHGGRIEVQSDARQRLVPSTAQYAVTLISREETNIPTTSIRGVVILNGQPESLLASVYRRALKVFMRESGA